MTGPPRPDAPTARGLLPGAPAAAAARAVPDGVGPTVSALLPRLVLVGGAVLGVVAQTVGRDLPPAALLPVALALLAAWRPSLPAAWLAVAGLMVLAVVGGPGGPAALDARTAVTVLAVHLVHVAAALAAVLPSGSRVETAALGPTWRRALLVQATSQLVLALAVVVR